MIYLNCIGRRVKTVFDLLGRSRVTPPPLVKANPTSGGWNIWVLAARLLLEIENFVVEVIRHFVFKIEYWLRACFWIIYVQGAFQITVEDHYLLTKHLSLYPSTEEVKFLFVLSLFSQFWLPCNVIIKQRMVISSLHVLELICFLVLMCCRITLNLM